jgi:hypothetical protein
MVRSVNEIRKYHIQARDGEIGAVEDFLFDDDAWTIRYVVVNTGKWMLGEIGAHCAVRPLVSGYKSNNHNCL